jgi:hypothetical protein
MRFQVQLGNDKNGFLYDEVIPFVIFRYTDSFLDRQTEATGYWDQEMNLVKQDGSR